MLPCSHKARTRVRILNPLPNLKETRNEQEQHEHGSSDYCSRSDYGRSGHSDLSSSKETFPQEGSVRKTEPSFFVDLTTTGLKIQRTLKIEYRVDCEGWKMPKSSIPFVRNMGRRFRKSN